LFGSKGSFVQTFFPVPSVGTSIGVPTHAAKSNGGNRGIPLLPVWYSSTDY
jgi:hypothetical protein